MSRRRDLDAAIMAHVGLDAVWGHHVVSEMATAYWVHPMMTHR